MHDVVMNENLIDFDTNSSWGETAVVLLTELGYEVSYKIEVCDVTFNKFIFRLYKGNYYLSEGEKCISKQIRGISVLNGQEDNGYNIYAIEISESHNNVDAIAESIMKLMFRIIGKACIVLFKCEESIAFSGVVITYEDESFSYKRITYSNLRKNDKPIVARSVLSTWIRCSDISDGIENIDKYATFNMSENSSSEFYEDYLYIIARDYDMVSISLEYIMYEMLEKSYDEIRSLSEEEFGEIYKNAIIERFGLAFYLKNSDTFGTDRINEKMSEMDWDLLDMELDIDLSESEETEEELFGSEYELEIYETDEDIDDDPELMIDWINENH